MAEPELPPARLHSASAESVALAHVLHGGRHALRIGRWLWTALMAAVCISTAVYHLIPRTPPNQPEDPRIRIEALDLQPRYEVVEIPNPNGPGTISTFRRKATLAPTQHPVSPPPWMRTEPRETQPQSP
jgi:hypothetical protein